MNAFLQKKMRVCVTLHFFFLLFFLVSLGEPSQKEFFKEIWKEAGTLPGPRSDFGTLYEKENVYVIGGTDNTAFLNTVFSGRILSNGTIGNWRAQPSLNSARSFFATVSHNNFVYILGGSAGTYNEFLLDTVERARVQPDGSLTKWSIEKHRLPNNARCLKAVFYKDHIYSVGGWNGSMMNSVARAKIQADGSLGKWETLSSETIYPRYIHSLILSKNTLFVLGGHDVSKGTGISQIEYADIGENGALGTWKLSSPLPAKLFGNAEIKYKDKLLLLGGRDKHTLSGAVFIGKIDAKKKVISGWQRATDLDYPLEHAGVFHNENNLYVLGGSNKRGARNTIYRGTLTEDGKLGNFFSENENKAIEAFNSAIDSFSQGDVSGAIHGFLKSISLNNTLWDAYYNLGMAYMANDSPEKAISLMNRVLKLNKGYEDAYILLAILHDKKGDIESSLKNINLAIKNGFGDMSFIINTPNLKNIRADKRFQELIEGYSSSSFMF